MLRNLSSSNFVNYLRTDLGLVFADLINEETQGASRGQESRGHEPSPHLVDKNLSESPPIKHVSGSHLIKTASKLFGSFTDNSARLEQQSHFQTSPRTPS